MLVVSISFGGRGRRGEALHFNKSFLSYPNPRRFPNTEFSISYFKIQTWAKKSVGGMFLDQNRYKEQVGSIHSFRNCTLWSTSPRLCIQVPRCVHKLFCYAIDYSFRQFEEKNAFRGIFKIGLISYEQHFTKD